MKSRTRVLRAERRITQRQLADMAGIDVHTVIAWEGGRIGGARLENLLKVADALGVGIEDLYADEER